MFLFDNNFYDKGFDYVAGVDEVGRGALAGPVVAAAVIFSKNCKIFDLNDSKRLSEKKRKRVSIIIKERSLDYSVEVVNSAIIDKINILEAVFLAMTKAILKLKIKPDLCLIDGNHELPNIDFRQKAIVKGDAKSACIAAASVLAKVARDRMMLEYTYTKQYYIYGFGKHKGYGTRMHMEALKKYGPSPIHRLTFAPVSMLITKK